MSKDFSPQMHWISYLRCPDIYLSNIMWTIDGKSFPMFTEDELADRRNHVAMQVLASDIYGKIRSLLSDEDFESLNGTLQKLVDADVCGGDMSAFPNEMLDWYFNRHDHYYHEPNDEEFLGFLEKFYGTGNKKELLK